jgi:glutamate--cysteine ligase
LHSTLNASLEALANSPAAISAANLQCGIEKEGLRITIDGRLAQTSHPDKLGASLTHPSITTDYAESLLELITPVAATPMQALNMLQSLHSYTAMQLQQQPIPEQIWPASMPGYLQGEDEIIIAHYGDSHIGHLKHIYRKGLTLRYGKIMQTIAGIHYNFSIDKAFWPHFQRIRGAKGDPNEFRSACYFDLIRNFRRHSWLLTYLFGACSALDPSFTEQRPTYLESDNCNSLIGPKATSLRMSELGYSNKIQASLNICFNDLNSYCKSLLHAINTPYSKYEKLGIKVDGKYCQLNGNILQVENEFYSDIRPKRVIRSGQKPVHALLAAGVEYVEVRSLDINPFLPIGIDLQQCDFLNCFLLWCLLSPSPVIDDELSQQIIANQDLVVQSGRQPDVKLQYQGKSILLQQAANNILSELRQIIPIMNRSKAVLTAIDAMIERIKQPDLTPSAQILAQMQAHQLSYSQLMQKLAQQQHEHHLRQPMDHATKVDLENQCHKSIEQRKALEANQQNSFDDYLSDYLTQ